MSQFLFTNFFHSLDIQQEQHWQFICAKLSRDYPWLLTEKANVCFSGIGQGWSGWARRDRFSSHAVFRSRLDRRLNATLSWLAHFRDAVMLAFKGPIVAIAPTPQAGLGVTLAKLILRKRIRLVVRVMSHGASKALHVRKNRLEFRIVDRIERFVLQTADLVLPMGTFTFELAISKGAKPEKTLILQFPVLWDRRAKIVELPSRPNILFVGRLVKEKGVDVLLRAMTLLLTTVPDARLFIAGDGKYRPTLEQTAESLGISDKVVFLGWLDAERLIEIFCNSSLLTVPSIVEEGMGMVLVEAGLMGRPVVASKIGGTIDIVRHQKNGLLVPPGEDEPLANAIATLLKDRDAARSMGLAGDRIARQYLEERDHAVECVRQAIASQLNDEAA